VGAVAATSLLVVCAVAPGLCFSVSPMRVAAGSLLLAVSCAGGGYLFLRQGFRELSWRARAAMSVGVGLVCIGPIQLVCGTLGPSLLAAAEAVLLCASLLGLACAARDWRLLPPAETAVPLLTVGVAAGTLLLFCLPAAREMSFAQDGSLVVQFVDMPFHVATVVGAAAIPVRNPCCPVLEMRYHYLLNVAAARLVHWIGLSAPDALYRAVRPLVLLAIILGLVALAPLVMPALATSHRSVSWIGPVVACGVPSLDVWVHYGNELRRLLLGHDARVLLTPHMGWNFASGTLVSVGGPGLCLVLIVLMGLLPARKAGFRLREAILFGFLAGSAIGFNIASYAIILGGLCWLGLACMRDLRGAGTVLAAALAALAWGFALKGHVTGQARASISLGTPHESLASHMTLLHAHDLAGLVVHIGPMLWVKVVLAAVGVGVLRGQPRLHFAVGMMLTALVLVVTGLLGEAGRVYTDESMSLAVTFLAVVGAASILSTPGDARTVAAVRRGSLLLAALLAVYLLSRFVSPPQVDLALGSGLVLPLALTLGVSRRQGVPSRWLPAGRAIACCAVIFGMTANTQFLWHTNRSFRVKADLVASLRDARNELPPAAVMAGPSTLISRAFLERHVAWTKEPAAWEWPLLEPLYVALSERPVIIGGNPPEAFAYVDSPLVAAGISADAARLFSCASQAEGEAIASRYGVTHLLAPRQERLPGAEHGGWLKSLPLRGALRVYDLDAGDK
jgi:hypothetical protein